MSIGTGVLHFRVRDVVNTDHDPIMHPATIEVSRRQKTRGDDHHLWNNHGHWWFHGTFHLPDGTAQRARVNLRTKDPEQARHRRDAILAGRCFKNSQTHAA